MAPWRSAGGLVWAVLMVVAGAAGAQQPKPPGMSLAAASAARFPQPVRAGDLIGRTVLQPRESKPVLGHVAAVVRSGTVLQIVVDYGGWFGFGSRRIAVPADGMALLGDQLDIVDFTPRQLGAFPTFDGAGATVVPPGDTIQVALARPSH